MINNRQSFRLRKQFYVTWSVPVKKIEGEGIIFNISRSGMLFVTDKLFEPDQGLDMFFRIEQVPSFPSKGKLVWFRKAGRKSSINAECNFHTRMSIDRHGYNGWKIIF
ncbi:MAG: PilZ domain-containing protein [Candidatus Omnitrophica bacterium]|nr:PilZ domain-containing protein [Candidatus Omnitrophota bacterium]